MPTQSDYERAAGQFERVSAGVEVLLDPARSVFQRGVIRGGLLTLELEALILRLQQQLRAHKPELDNLALVARQRARLCEEYLQLQRAYDRAYDAYIGEMRAWYAADAVRQAEPLLAPDPGPPPLPPPAPPPRPAWMSL